MKLSPRRNVAHPTAPHAPPDARVAALVGRQNSGKTSVLMHLTGTDQHPVNFPGSSVERIEATLELPGDGTYRIVDLPGISSLEPLSPDEALAVDFVRETGSGRADVLLVVADASRLPIDLSLVEEVAGLDKPVIVVLTKLDVAQREGRRVDPRTLTKLLGVPVIPVDGRTGRGVDSVRDALAKGAAQPLERGAAQRALQWACAAFEEPAGAASATERVDRVLLHPVAGPLVALVVVFALFQLIYNGAEPFIELIEAAQAAASAGIRAVLGPGALRDFLVDGVINGIGSVVVFVPQIALLIGAITVLESSGYMARAVFLLDRLLHRVGLSGRSFVPLVSGFACAIPAILSTRMMEDERDRLATIAVIPLMSCSARLPVYVVLAGAFFAPVTAGMVLLGIYLLGIALAFAVAWALRRTALKGGHPSVLMLELPPYQPPAWRVVWARVRVAVREFLSLAGTVIAAASILIWFASYYPRPASIHARWQARAAEATAAAGPRELPNVLERIELGERAEYLEQSFLARLGRAVQPVFRPAGFDWKTTVGILSAFPARELIVPTLAILYQVGEIDPDQYDLSALAPTAGEPDSLRARLRAAKHPDGSPVFTRATALALMVFFALCMQCVSTLATIRRETHSWRWPLFVFTYMTVLAWVAAVVTFHVATWLGA